MRGVADRLPRGYARALSSMPSTARMRATTRIETRGASPRSIRPISALEIRAERATASWLSPCCTRAFRISPPRSWTMRLPRLDPASSERSATGIERGCSALTCGYLASLVQPHCLRRRYVFVPRANATNRIGRGRTCSDPKPVSTWWTPCWVIWSIRPHGEQARPCDAWVAPLVDFARPASSGRDTVSRRRCRSASGPSRPPGHGRGSSLQAG